MTRQHSVQARPTPAHAGVGLRPPHFQHVLRERPAVPWFELHTENFFCAGGEMHSILEAVRCRYPLSLHGVGLSLGSADALNRAHLHKLKQLVDRYQPVLISEHLCWGALDGQHFNDLLPMPYTEESLALMVDRVTETQDVLGRQILIENVSSYLTYTCSTIGEGDFLAQLARRSGAAILLDVNNVYVNAINHGIDACSYIRSLPPDSVKEIHLAGFTRKLGLAAELLIDSHDHPVDPAVWALYRETLQHTGPVPTLIEWDQNLPEFEVLLSEAATAETLLDAYRYAIA